MGFRSVLSKPFAAYIAAQTRKWAKDPVGSQERILQQLISTARDTTFGNDHGFAEIRNHDHFKSAVPVRDYEELKPYVAQILDGDQDVLWPGKPTYFAKTSGTTSGTKYIPITKESLPNHINSARNALLSYVHETGNSAFLDGKLIFLSGSPELDMRAGIHTGRLSGIVNHHVPGYLRTNQLPSFETNCIDDWETKLDRIIDETIDERMTLISGIPPWVQMYFDRIEKRTGKKIKDVFRDFSLFVYGGVNFEPYRAKLFESIGKSVDSIETYPASEGFIAYQDSQHEEGLLLLLNSGIFFEFIPADRFFEDNPPRLTIGEVETNVNYAVIINSNAGLWGYNLGDTIKFVSTDPYRVIVSGRIKHFISAFGEHVIGEEVEKAMRESLTRHPEAEIVEFTVAPNVTPTDGRMPHHQWLIEFSKMPSDLDAFIEDLDHALRRLNSYYDDLLSGNILKVLEIVPLRRSAFIDYMKDQGKLGGQNKVPRLSNDRKIAGELIKYRKND
ncbi:GH3 auxin-responsive promoter family protein [Fulvivirga sedimenti]|uniref:GH3 auxin-responsive promoter family protein n=1 Tax=Fulvivirga sedimenti TaxID=2879465 RepID=A0A9X1KZ69_9BACT|nr:GH3 auxin-responsive promoter family protein [Fulvivirga sedimenti]MCA6075552.1 GH3 auxin-responsive promoter family protein [Fulvivirga sedimenti]MCA6076729.1 GH3 auxin-responsive promoter family protein [Fulvivirga sedimenti]MCA6077857.1 GH3 auxin-responsive promoter family protein [Fulvivirga sedimenti]